MTSGPHTVRRFSGDDVELDRRDGVASLGDAFVIGHQLLCSRNVPGDTIEITNGQLSAGEKPDRVTTLERLIIWFERILRIYVESELEVCGCPIANRDLKRCRALIEDAKQGASMKDADLRRLLAIEQPALDWFRARAFGEDVSRQTETVNALKEAIRLNAWRPSVHDNAAKVSGQHVKHGKDI